MKRTGLDIAASTEKIENKNDSSGKEKDTSKFSDIVERVEYLRKLIGVNKSRFAKSIEMQPQTYNNFIGAQGSKPSVALIRGIINSYNVSAMWLLNGRGPIFMDDEKAALDTSTSPQNIMDLSSAKQLEVFGEKAKVKIVRELESLAESLGRVSAMAEEVKDSQDQDSSVPEATRTLVRNFRKNPIATLDKMAKALLDP